MDWRAVERSLVEYFNQPHIEGFDVIYEAGEPFLRINVRDHDYDFCEVRKCRICAVKPISLERLARQIAAEERIAA